MHWWNLHYWTTGRVSVVIVAVAAAIYVWQAREMRSQARTAESLAETARIQAIEAVRASELAATVELVRMLQHEDMRKQRRVLFNGGFGSETEEFIEAVDRVSHTFQSVGYLVERGLVSEDLVLDNWGETLLLCWEACEPFAVARRNVQGYQPLWAAWEKLAKAERRRRDARGTSTS